MIIEKNAKIWGTADAGESVKAVFLGKTYKAAADKNGYWEIHFDAGEFGGPHELKIGDAVIRDVKVGYVWLCGGQSNMELPISRVRRMFEDELCDVNFPDIRAFVVRKAYDFNNELQLYEGGWQYAISKNIDNFYATAYFFARRVYERYKVPVGLICCAAGGSTAEAWISGEALEAFPRYKEILMECKDIEFVKETERMDLQSMQEWFGELDENDMGKQEAWEALNYDDSRWSERELTESWEKDLNINGSVWFRKTVDIPQSMAGSPATLMLGRVVDNDFVYVNGKFAGRVEYQYPPSIFKLPEDMLRLGKNVIAVRVISNSGLGGFVKDKPYKILTGGGEVSLLGKWKYKVGYVMRPMPEHTFFFKKPAGLYNAMLSPVIRYPITGVVWYQGESNTPHPGDYDKLMSALIKDWRKKWGKDFPFIFTQLANYEDNSAAYPQSLWAELREKQLLCLNIPNTAMASAIDCGEYNDLHPLDKKTVGERLALAAFSLAYGEDVVSSGPIARAARLCGEKIIISFDSTGSGLKFLGRAQDSFEIETEDGGCFKEDAEIHGNTVIVNCSAGRKPKLVRYAWADNPAAVLYNMEGLPAAPFRITLCQG